MFPNLRILWVISLLSLVIDSALAARKTNLPRPADPFADPRNDPYNPLRYIASDVLTGIAFGLVLFVAIAQSLSIWKWGAKFMLSMTIGAYSGYSIFLLSVLLPIYLGFP